MSDILKTGSKGPAVTVLQDKLAKLGFDVTPDGNFGGKTDTAVRSLQTMFGYTVDGMVGDATTKLMDAQIGYGWHAQAADAKDRALAAQGMGGKAAVPAAAPGQSKLGGEKAAVPAAAPGQSKFGSDQ
jgi:peptidoglycan hydrolase-like protein with peptidoglycan-binding domain